ncbi:hypothetical protein BDW22DRAFT_1394091 [Trametopsis cervina]|nr:hypothetical protein BDW22DRAFT_1394091 [Trametopsis cervina]
MSEGAGSSSNPAPNPTPTRAIASLAKKQSDVTRLGTQKLKFVPTLPTRRKKDTDRGRGRGRGRGDASGRGGRGRGDGGSRGGAPSTRPPAVEMTASGPFALGPAMAGAAGSRRSGNVPRSNFMPVMPRGGGLSGGVKREPNDLGGIKTEGVGGASGGVVDEEGEVYSDPDDGVEIVDMENVRGMDWMAPESLKREKDKGRSKDKGKGKDSKPEVDKKGKGVVKPGGDAPAPMDEDEDVAGEEGETKVNLANALNLSDSEEEEELEDIIDDFAAVNMEDADVRQERLYFFQFPNPFPKFFSPSAAPPEDKGKGKETAGPEPAGKKVSFAPDAKPAAPGAAPGPSKTQPEEEPEPKAEGLVGQLEVYASGAVKMRLANGILLDVTASTQPTFLQHATYVDPESKRLCVLGEVNRRFVVSPDVDALLESLEKAEIEIVGAQIGELEGLLRMES